MELMWLIYIISTLTKVNNVAAVVAIFGVASTCIAFLVFLVEETRVAIVCAKWGALATSLCLIISVLVPSEKTMYIMAGAYAAQKVIAHPEVRDMSEDVLVIIKNKLKQYADESINELDSQKKE